MPKIQLTKREIDKLPETTNPRGEQYMDKSVAGFGVQVYPSGRKMFFVRYSAAGKRRKMTLGQFGLLTADEARKEARQVLALVLRGEDPMSDREQARQIPTFSQWVAVYMEEVERRKKHPRNDRRYLGMAEKTWGGQQLDTLTADDVRRAFQLIVTKGTPIDANRWLASVRACLQAAWREDKIPNNPAMKVRPNPENPPRSRVLSEEELQRLYAAIHDLDDVHVQAAFRLLLETGARLSEVLNARWEQFDLGQGHWRLASTKSGRPQVVPLGPQILEALRNLPVVGPWVVPGRDPSKRRADLKRPWEALKKVADLDDIHIHDLRRTFGLQMTRQAGLHIASKLLRHADIRVTERHYAPLGLDTLREALEKRESFIVPLRKIRNEQVD